MYDEEADFAHHEGEVRTFYQTLAAWGYEPLPSHVILDLGGGQGMHAGFLSTRFAKVWCLDAINYSTLYGGQFVKLLIEKYERHGVPLIADRLIFVQGDAMNLLFRDNFFDACLCINAFEHVANPQEALTEIRRVLRPGGWAYISFDPVWTCDTGSHFFHRVAEPWGHLVYSAAEFAARMLSNGASPDEVREFSSAMNRWRVVQFRSVFQEAQRCAHIDIVHTEYMVRNG